MSGGVELGVFPVRGTASEADAFRLAIGQPPGGAALPLTFPMRWLAARDIRVALAALVGHGEVVLVHEGQNFSFERPLLVGEPYDLTLSVRREQSPERLILQGVIASGEEPCARLETTLRLVAAPAGTAA